MSRRCPRSCAGVSQLALAVTRLGPLVRIRPGAGGQTLVAISDAAGPNNVQEFECELNPGDVIACSAVASNTVTVTRTPPGGTAQTILQITGVTTKAFVIGLYG